MTVLYVVIVSDSEQAPRVVSIWDTEQAATEEAAQLWATRTSSGERVDIAPVPLHAIDPADLARLHCG